MTNKFREKTNSSFSFNKDKFVFFEFTDNLQEEWDKFVIENKRGSVHQISDFKKLQESIPGRGPVLGFGARDKISRKILATVFCVKMQTGFLNKFWWYSARGPVFDDESTEAVEFLIFKVREILMKQEKGLFWRLDPYLETKDTDIFANFSVKQATQNYQPTDTLELDLTKSEELLLSEMKRKGRYNIKLSAKKGVIFREILASEVTEQDLDDFYNLNNETTSRDGFSGHQKSYYRSFIKNLDKYAVLFFAEFEGKRIATAISTFCGDKAIYYFGASTSDRQYRNLMAPYGLQWFMINFAKKRGCKTYDFLGIAPENEPNHAYAGISDFKWKFGGYRKTYRPGVEIVFAKFWYKIYRLVKKLR